MESLQVVEAAKLRRNVAERARTARIRRILAAARDGLSSRAIALQEDVSPSLVRRVIRSFGEKIDLPEKVAGMDGRSHPARKLAPAAQAAVVDSREGE